MSASVDGEVAHAVEAHSAHNQEIIVQGHAFRGIAKIAGLPEREGRSHYWCEHAAGADGKAIKSDQVAVGNIALHVKVLGVSHAAAGAGNTYAGDKAGNAGSRIHLIRGN